MILRKNFSISSLLSCASEAQTVPHALKAINLPLNYNSIPSFFFKCLIEINSEALWAWNFLWWMTFYYLFNLITCHCSSLIFSYSWFSPSRLCVSWNLFIRDEVTDKFSVWQRPTFYFIGSYLCVVSSYDRLRERKSWRFLYRN